MESKTAELWDTQDKHKGDRERLFTAIARVVAADAVLYPGSYVDLAPSFVFRSVTYVDVDKRAARFFSDRDGVGELIAAHRGPPNSEFRFLHSDYNDPLPLPEDHFDLLVSLYAGFVSEHCTQHLRVGGTLLVNPSHGDAAMASIDQRYELSGVLISKDANYHVESADLTAHLVPKRPTDITAESLHRSGRGVAYTKTPFAYLFTRIC